MKDSKAKRFPIFFSTKSTNELIVAAMMSGSIWIRFSKRIAMEFRVIITHHNTGIMLSWFLKAVLSFIPPTVSRSQVLPLLHIPLSRGYSGYEILR